jgi:membrane fusion protein (multidrug efflux system)
VFIPRAAVEASLEAASGRSVVLMPLILTNFRAAAPLVALVSVAAVAALAALAGCGSGEGEAAPRGANGSNGARPTVAVGIEPAVIGRASSYYTATATLEAESHAQILARTTGVARELLREEGDAIAADETLLLLEDDEARLRVAQAEANLKTARAEHDRAEQMEKSGLLSAGEFETNVNALRVREAELELAKLQLSYTRVRSPIEGRVVRRFVDLGANVVPGMPLFEVMDVTPLLARVHIPAKRMGFIATGQTMEVRLEGTAEPLTAAVSLVSPIVDPATGTVKVTAEVRQYPTGTRAGDFAEVRIVTASHDQTILVPSRAVFEEQGKDILYVVESGKAVRRVVETGFIDGDLTEILDGVAERDLVVVKGQRQLQDGSGVEVLEGPPEILAELKAAVPDSAAAEPKAGTETADAS